MFTNTKAFSGFAVDDLEAAKKFYGEVLGLDVAEENGLLNLHLAGGRDTLVYPKPDHAPATYTILNFPVPDIAAAVDELTARGRRVRALRRIRPGRQGHLPWRRRSADRLVHRSGRQHPLGAPVVNAASRGARSVLE